MPFNFQTFKTRALTAIIFVAVMLVGLLYNHWSFFILFSVIHFGCWIEYQKLVALIDPEYKTISSFHRNTIMLLGFSFMLYMTNDTYKIGRVPLQAIGWYGIMLFTIVFCLNEILLKKTLNVKMIGYSVFGLVYISLSWGLMIDLRNIGMSFKGATLFFDFGRYYPVIIIASIWINDTMQYMVGSFIGKTPFSKISPKKTWEGTIGGSLICIVIAALVPYFVNHIFDYTTICVAAIAAVLGTLGDLLESKLKRMAGVKDSGQIMPGHGGFLDRFDSLLLATPFVWLFVKFVIGLG
ncbi:MAG: phosphatidate cytidylyltransferase [Pedobacter sp.]|nr:phosphatidate cytidylyltransferase [Chitinophagaceae bacterium]